MQIETPAEKNARELLEQAEAEAEEEKKRDAQALLDAKRDAGDNDDVKEVNVPQEALDAFDISEERDHLPSSYELEIVAADLMDHLAALRVMTIQRKAARQAQNGAKAEALTKDILYHRSAAALIQWMYPGKDDVRSARSLAEEMMQAVEASVRKTRLKNLTPTEG